MASNTEGISALRKAEEEASRAVDAARASRVQRMKQAKAEAAKDISKYQEEQEGKLAELAQQRGDKTASLATLEKDTDIAVEAMRRDAAKNQDPVIAMMLGVVMSVHVAVPEARKGMVK